MKNHSLITQYRITLVLIVISSIVASLITYVVAVMLFIYALNNNKIYPVDYYEQQIPKIEEYIHEVKSFILSFSNEEILKQMIHGDEIFYQVVDSENNILYGTYRQSIFETKEQIFQRLNTTFNTSGYYIRVIPVIGDEGKLDGAVSLVYKLSLSSANKSKTWISIALVVVLFAPFIYVIVFTILFSRIFAKNISHPLKILVDASHQIKKKNLDFEIDYHSTNELGELCTAFSEMKEELKKSLSAQWNLEQERIEMVEALAHDLKSPLSIIKVYSEALIDDTGVDEEQRQYLAVIEENIEKSVSLVQQMQYTSELDNFSVSLIQLPVNLTEFLEQKVNAYELLAKQKGIAVNLEFQNNIPTSILTDIDKLERILDNIVSNSMQYTPTNGQINISVKAEKQRIYYSICDTGTGFSAKDMEKAFEKFYRGDEARQTKDGCSGLGLYIVKHLVELLGGSIKIENSKLGGANVRFYIKV